MEWEKFYLAVAVRGKGEFSKSLYIVQTATIEAFYACRGR